MWPSRDLPVRLLTSFKEVFTSHFNIVITVWMCYNLVILSYAYPRKNSIQISTAQLLFLKCIFFEHQTCCLQDVTSL